MISEGQKRRFLQRFVVGVGVLAGVWTGVGVALNEQLWLLLARLFEVVPEHSYWSLVFWLVPLLLVVLDVYLAARNGGIILVFAVGVAFMGGLAMHNVAGIICLVAAALLSFLVPASPQHI